MSLVNPNETGNCKEKQCSLEVDKKGETKSIKANYDEIVTVKRENTEEGRANHTIVNGKELDNDQCKQKSFSLQSAWCCLRSRRSS